MPMRLPKKHISLYRADAVNAVCSPLFSSSPISYFHYAKLYQDGSSSIVVTHPEFHQHFWAQKYDEEIFSHYQPGVFFNENYAHQALLDARDHGCDNLMMFINKRVDHLEVIGFAAKPEERTTPSYYLKHMETLKKFCHYFKDQGKSLIIEADKNLLFTENYQPIYLKDAQQNTNPLLDTISSTLNEMKISNLTKMELKCLEQLLKGKTSKMTAEELNLSARTVEHHVERLKIKLSVRYRTDLIKLFV